MADFTSTQSGDWNAGATWVGGTAPTSNDDTATIGHDVAYNLGESAITWGNVTINASGSLTFPTDSSSTIVFNTTGKLTVNSNGTLTAGTSGTPIDKAYTCKFHWPQGAAARDALELNDGGTIDIYGDPDYYGSSRYAYLDADWETGQTFYITGDYSAKWQAGQKFYIHENKQYSNYQSDGHVYTIATGGVGSYDAGNDRTPITIDETAPSLTFTAVHATTDYASKLIMISRNVELCDPAATLDVYDYGSYTEQLRFDNNQATANSLIHFNDVRMSGWDRGVDGGYNFIGENIVFVSNSSGIYSSTNPQVTGDFVSNNFGIYSGTNYQVTGDFVSNNYAINTGTNHQVTGDFVSNNTGINSGTNNQVTGNFISNSTGIYIGTNNQVTGNFVSNNTGILFGTNHQVTGNFISNSTGILSGTNHQVIGDFDNTTDVSLTSATTLYRAVLEDCTLAGIARMPLRIYGNSGNFLPLESGDTNWQTPPSANSWILEAIPNANCSTTLTGTMPLAAPKPMATYLSETGSQVLTFKVCPIGWATALDQDDIVLEAKYLDSASGITRTTAVNTTAEYANASWRDLSVTVNPSQAGVLYFNVFIRRYESSATILIDPVWSIA